MEATTKIKIKMIGTIVLVVGGMLAIGQWAGAKNAERDAGIVELWAYSPRTMQTYLVRATPGEEEGSFSFQLESSFVYHFEDCFPPEWEGDEERTASCRDQNQDRWDFSAD